MEAYFSFDDLCFCKVFRALSFAYMLMHEHVFFMLAFILLFFSQFICAVWFDFRVNLRTCVCECVRVCVRVVEVVVPWYACRMPLCVCANYPQAVVPCMCVYACTCRTYTWSMGKRRRVGRGRRNTARRWTKEKERGRAEIVPRWPRGGNCIRMSTSKRPGDGESRELNARLLENADCPRYTPQSTERLFKRRAQSVCLALPGEKWLKCVCVPVLAAGAGVVTSIGSFWARSLSLRFICSRAGCFCCGRASTSGEGEGFACRWFGRAVGLIGKVRDLNIRIGRWQNVARRNSHLAFSRAMCIHCKTLLYNL